VKRVPDLESEGLVAKLLNIICKINLGHKHVMHANHKRNQDKNWAVEVLILLLANT